MSDGTAILGGQLCPPCGIQFQAFRLSGRSAPAYLASRLRSGFYGARLMRTSTRNHTATSGSCREDKSVPPHLAIVAARLRSASAWTTVGQCPSSWILAPDKLRAQKVYRRSPHPHLRQLRDRGVFRAAAEGGGAVIDDTLSELTAPPPSAAARSWCFSSSSKNYMQFEVHVGNQWS
jgi:hypothetical protein